MTQTTSAVLPGHVHALQDNPGRQFWPAPRDAGDEEAFPQPGRTAAYGSLRAQNGSFRLSDQLEGNVTIKKDMYPSCTERELPFE